MSLQLSGADVVLVQCQMSQQECVPPNKLEEPAAVEAQQTASVEGDGSQPLGSSGTKVWLSSQVSATVYFSMVAILSSISLWAVLRFNR